MDNLEFRREYKRITLEAFKVLRALSRLNFKDIDFSVLPTTTEHKIKQLIIKSKKIAKEIKELQ